MIFSMTREEQQRLYALAVDPPPGSKLEAAKKHGVDFDSDYTELDS
jgi:hypothetical protein